jgi:phytoene dehydrogenase-like protein
MSKIIIVGTGMGSLSAAALLAKEGHELTILEQNYLPGGCSSSYFRQGFIFESGATTLVGFDKGMPLGFLFDEIGLEIDTERLKVPMKVHLKNGETLIRHNDLEQWISEAESIFGTKGQRSFWKFCFSFCALFTTRPHHSRGIMCVNTNATSHYRFVHVQRSAPLRPALQARPTVAPRRLSISAS